MFIKSNCAFEFENPESGERLRIPKDYMGDLPDWVAKTPLYQLATQGERPAIATIGEKKVTAKGTKEK